MVSCLMISSVPVIGRTCTSEKPYLVLQLPLGERFNSCMTES